MLRKSNVCLLDGVLLFEPAKVCRAVSAARGNSEILLLLGDEASPLRYDYDFAAVLPGLSFMTRYYKGQNGEFKGREAREWESDTHLRYVVQDRMFKGLDVELRKATYRSTYTSDRDNYRLYLTYDLALW